MELAREELPVSWIRAREVISGVSSLLSWEWFE